MQLSDEADPGSRHKKKEQEAKKKQAKNRKK
jgi:hypothetical protein